MDIEIRSYDDWIVVYKDGRKVWENHSCSLQRGLEALGIPFNDVDLFDVADEDGYLPDGSDAFPNRL